MDTIRQTNHRSYNRKHSAVKLLHKSALTLEKLIFPEAFQRKQIDVRAPISALDRAAIAFQRENNKTNKPNKLNYIHGMYDTTKIYNKRQILEMGIAHLEDLEAKGENLCRALREIDQDFNYFTFGMAGIKYVELLEQTMGDACGWIEYYIYEAEYGKRKSEVTIQGKEFVLEDVNTLYEIMKLDYNYNDEK